MTTGERSATLGDRLAERLRVVPDFPEPGVQFQDVTPVLGDAVLLADSVSAMAEPWRGAGVTHVAGIESRGFIFGAPIALALAAGFVPIRKPGKLPWRRAARTYALEYGSGQLEVHEDALPPPARVLVVDDVLATGGTASAACALVESIGGIVAGCAFFLAISALDGIRMLEGRRVETLLER
jgi:adenine phosphoribosyltransferase